MSKKKQPSVEDIINGYQKFHHKTGKGFKERIKKFEEFNDPENIHGQQLIHHAHYTLFGKPSDLKTYPGAYNEAYKVLDRIVEDDNDKLENEDKLAEIMETYTNSFLQQAMGSKFKETIAYAEKEGKLSKKDLRDFKGQLLGRYHVDERGNPINILHDQYIKGLKGKNKLELIEHLQNLSEKMKRTYSTHLLQQASEGLISDEDRLDMAKYITPIFKERGWKHKHSHITRSAEDQAQHYSLLLGGASKELQERGYKPTKHEKKDKE